MQIPSEGMVLRQCRNPGWVEKGRLCNETRRILGTIDSRGPFTASDMCYIDASFNPELLSSCTE